MRGRLGIGTEWVVDRHRALSSSYPGRLAETRLVDGRPLLRVEVARPRSGPKAEGRREALRLERREDAATDRHSGVERVREEPPVALGLRRQDEWLRAPDEAQHARIDGRRRRERRA